MINLHWAIHNHQPVGNFDFIFERAFQQAYRPFLEVLEAHPRIRMSMHFSGILLDWLERNHAEYIAELRKVVDRGQLEILGGGFYEPILPVISDADKVGQLRKLSLAVHRLFGTMPKGIWLAERVWEPTLVKPIAEAGLEYVLLDGSHFKMVGKTEKDMDGYFVSEDQGHTLKLFPIHDVIRDYIPFRGVDEVIDTLLALEKPLSHGARDLLAQGAVAQDAVAQDAVAQDAVAQGANTPGNSGVTSGGVVVSPTADVQVVFGDDGEKFGDWPFTHDTVYKSGWLHRFFERVEGLSDRIRVEPVGAGLKPEKNLGLVYLPPASYQEMMVWAQDARDIPKFRKAQQIVIEKEGQDSAKFLRGTFWRNFFNKYSESNQIHKQGIRLSQTLAKARASMAEEKASEAQDHIWQAQCNCAYWHGVFGGLYLPHLRFGLYRNLVAAQKILDAEAPKDSVWPQWEIQDWNCDGKLEYSLNTPEAYISFSQQGEIDQFWLKASGFNLVDTLTRRFEAYHAFVGGQGEAGDKLENQLGEKESGLRGYLVYDRKIRRSVSDVYLKPGTDFQEYAAQGFTEAFDFVSKEVSLQRLERETRILFQGVAHTPDGRRLQVEKCFVLEKGQVNLRVEWTFRAAENTAGTGAGARADKSGARTESEFRTELDFRFGSETLFCLLAGNAHDRYIEWNSAGNGTGPGSSAGGGTARAIPAQAALARDILASHGDMGPQSKVTITDEWLKVRCETTFAGASSVWRDAIETVSQSEGGYERVYQGTVVLPVWDFHLAPGQTGKAAMSIQIREGV